MTQQLDERKIIEALNKVATIDGSSDIVTAGAVSGIVIKEGHIGFTVEIDPRDKDQADQLRAAAEKAVLALDGALSATAMLTAHQSGPSMPSSDRLTPPGNGAGGTAPKQSEPHQPATHVRLQLLRCGAAYVHRNRPCAKRSCESSMAPRFPVSCGTKASRGNKEVAVGRTTPTRELFSDAKGRSSERDSQSVAVGREGPLASSVRRGFEASHGSAIKVTISRRRREKACGR